MPAASISILLNWLTFFRAQVLPALALLGFVLASLGWETVLRSQKLIAVLPWLLVALDWRRCAGFFRAITRSYRFAIAGSLLLSGWIVVAQPWAESSAYVFRHALVYSAWLPVAVLTATLLSQVRDAARALSAAVMLVLGIFAVALVIEFVRHGGQVRPKGINHNVLVGSLAIMLTGVCAFLHHRWPSALTHVARWGSLAAATLIVAITGARAPWVALVIAAVAAFVVLRAHSSKRQWVAAAWLIAFLFLFSAPRFGQISDEISAHAQGSVHTSIGARLDVWRWLGQHGAEHPWRGWGPHGLQASLANRAYEWGVDPAQTVLLPHLHNDALQIYAAYGAPAVAGYALMMLGWLYAGLRQHGRRSAGGDARGSDSMRRSASATLIFVVLMLLVAGQADSPLFWPPMGMAFIFCVGVAVGLKALADAGVDTDADVDTAADANGHRSAEQRSHGTSAPTAH